MTIFPGIKRFQYLPTTAPKYPGPVYQSSINPHLNISLAAPVS